MPHTFRSCLDRESGGKAAVQKAASGDTQPYIFAQVWECGRLRELKKN
jgi:hypothetical protein